ncbi:MAG: adenylyltransferase/cytidyltransferase family protein [Patescibacteria group bacterium]
MKKKTIKVIVFGTFDILHPGHLDFLKQAKALGDFLIVSVSRDDNARKFKGYSPLFGENDRLEIIKNLKIVDRAVLGDRHYYLKHTLKEKPDIIALGYDQTAYAKNLLADIKAGKLKVKLVRLKPHKSHYYKSSKFKNLIKRSHGSLLPLIRPLATFSRKGRRA